MTKKQLINSYTSLGNLLLNPDEKLSELIATAQNYNAWFTPENTLRSVQSIGKMLNQEDLEKWLAFENGVESGISEADKLEPQESSIETSENSIRKAIGLVLAGNIPMVGFHDILCVLAAGHKAMIKLSSQDNKLTVYVLQKLVEIEPDFADKFEFVERLKDFDAVIATGSNNTSRYFDYYFSKVPHIIRKNRNSIAVLTGLETTEQLKHLGNDIFNYFGLGCRNVSKLFVPAGYNFNIFFESIEIFKSVADHHKYNNNYDYNKSIFLVNLQKHLDNGFLLLKQDDRIASSLAVLYFEEYADRTSLEEKLISIEDQLQCIVTGSPLNISSQEVSFGQSQQPKLWDYADGVNTMEFLYKLG
ncbi:MAG: acyl-CoA reductase [Sphingobacteriales bacterium]|nr:acyl-CoA reductase [Sphingobacteriales bacterium]